MKLFLIIFFPIPAFAADLVLCDPASTPVANTASVQRNLDPTAYLTNPNALIHSSPPPPVRAWDGTVPASGSRYWKCTGNSVVEMTQAEKDSLDAPLIAEQARQQAFTDEIASNDLCTAELADIISRVETRRTTLRAAVESQRVTNNTTITNAANNVAGVKAAMTTVNNATAAEFGQTVDELAALATKIAKCVRARQR